MRLAVTFSSADINIPRHIYAFNALFAPAKMHHADLQIVHDPASRAQAQHYSTASRLRTVQLFDLFGTSGRGFPTLQFPWMMHVPMDTTNQDHAIDR